MHDLPPLPGDPPPLSSGSKKPSPAMLSPAPVSSSSKGLVVGLVVVGAAVGLAWALWPSSASASTGGDNKQTPTPGPGPTPGPTPGPAPSPTPGPNPGPVPPLIIVPSRPVEEAQECTAVAAAKPQTFKDKSRPPQQPEDEWLAYVIYWRVYPDGPVEPQGDMMWKGTWARILACVQQKLGKTQGGDIPPANNLPAPLSPEPKPGLSYQINPEQVSSLYGLASKTYGTQRGSHENFVAAKRINDHPYNRRFWVEVAGEAAQFPGGRISFNPIFGSIEQQVADTVGGGRGKGGHKFAALFLPPAPNGGGGLKS